MSDPLRILHVFSRLGRGGAELRTVEMLRRVDARYAQFDFCSLSGLPGELDAEVEALGGRVQLLRRGLLGFPRSFQQWLHDRQFHVVYAHVLDYSGIVLRLAARCNVPVRVAMFRSPRDDRTAGTVRIAYRKLMRSWLDRYATHLVGVSEGVLDSVWGRRWRSDPRCQVIYNGIDPATLDGTSDRDGVAREFGLPADAPWYVHIGHLRRPKNHLRLLSIFAHVVQRQPSARLLLVGQGGDVEWRGIRQRIADLGLTGRVGLAGQRTDVPRLLKAADAMIFPSLWEGLPGAVLEACGLGTPTLASDLPGIREIASRLPFVRCLSLEEDDARWAEVAMEMCHGGSTPQQRETARRKFANSVFTIGRCVQQHRRIWEEAKPASVARAVAC
ncbi:MAG: glycosyltransferase [Pirellulales bacterium]|nr:glycosyltransferase [Pirellulales bacterium]